MIIDPYETMVGKIVNTDIEENLNRFLIDTPNKILNYEYRSMNDTIYVFITGCNDYEKELPVFKHPIMITDSIKNRKHLFMDIRQFVNVRNVNRILNISDVLRDKSNFNILLVRGIYQDILDKNPNYITTYTDAIVGSITSMISSVMNMGLVLNPQEVLDLNITIMHYLLHMLDSDVESIPVKIYRLSVIKGDIDYIREIISRLDVPIDVDGLANNISKCSKSVKLLNINSDLIYGLTRGMFYCDNNVELLAMMLEHPPTMVSMLFNAYDDRMYSKSRLTTILINNKRKIPIELFAKRVSNEVNDRKII